MFSCFSQVRLCYPMGCRPLDASVHGILLARILEWVAMPSSRESSHPRDQTHFSCIGGGFFTTEPPGKPNITIYHKLIPKVKKKMVRRVILGFWCEHLVTIFLKRFIYFIFWLWWVFVAAHRLSLVAASRGYSLLQLTGFSLQWLFCCCKTQAVGIQASVVAVPGLSSCSSQAPECWLSTCGTRA